MNTALIVVDMQKDFLPNGALGVDNGHRAVMPLIGLADESDLIIFTRDWHPADHISFSDDPEYKDFSWPPHCVQGTEGAEIDEWLWDYVRDTGKPTLLVHKGDIKDQEAYSGFQGHVVDTFNINNWRKVEDLTAEPPSLFQAMFYLDVRSVKIGGLALDYCVKATAIDSRTYYGDTTVYLDATRPVDYLTGVRAVAELCAKGVRLA